MHDSPCSSSPGHAALLAWLGRSLWAALLVTAGLCLTPRAALADECGILPADPDRIVLATEVDEDRALELYDKAYLAYSEGNCHCTAWYNLKAYEMQPTPVLMTNIAAALERCEDLDAARRYARKTLTLEGAAERERNDAQALIARVDQALASETYANVTLDAYEAEAMTVGHVSWVRGDNPTLRRGTYDVQVTRSGKKGAMERIEVPPSAAAAGCTSDAECGAAQRCELATGQCFDKDAADDGLDPLLIGGAVTATVGLALLVTGMVIDLSMTSEVSLYESFQDSHEGCFDGDASTRCDASEDEIAEYNDRGSSLETLRAASLGTYISGALLAAAGTGLLIYALVSDSGSEASASLEWSVAPLASATSPVDGGWLGLRVRF